jgi:peptidoglycan/LPS O-acetylase OafA/YrhL
MQAGDWQTSDSNIFLVFGPVIVCFGFSLIILAVGHSGFANSFFFTQPFLVFIGLISYSFYLYHLGVLFLIGKLLAPHEHGWSWTAGNLLCACVALPLTIFLAWVAWATVEEPANWLRKSIIENRKNRTARR